ncbi:cell surface spherulin 4-like protein [Eremomyces bilateralis CBS 781.70]|uniref:Cell surface spherulin 4-like protein n=1 Tax=Eremomyces bilateralis CBS 781.70 TaxID=1392243 RepID=A0A6G1G2X5_9PEZI|nr:cell surface spherulin 4-like protein [Eremomyces bilateralis CBS 781.70]KAF1812159.1 cell surface spherulin 4-like protein [Eremomyces bilateralis CBS 781.70]
MSPRSEILLPLYIYPTSGAWNPLHQVILAYPAVRFTVVINPASGPGDGPLPDYNYTREIATLNTFDNVRTIGYVATTYGKKSLEAVMQEIDRYANWALLDPALELSGIFLDETPTLYTDANGAYLPMIQTNIKNTVGLGSGLVVHNPGTIPDVRFAAAADVTVLFEQTYDVYVARSANDTVAPATLLFDRERIGAIVHTCPDDLGPQEMKQFVEEVEVKFGWLYLTDLGENYYHNFSTRFLEFVQYV